MAFDNHINLNLFENSDKIKIKRLKNPKNTPLIVLLCGHGGIVNNFATLKMTHKFKFHSFNHTGLYSCLLPANLYWNQYKNSLVSNLNNREIHKQQFLYGFLDLSNDTTFDLNLEAGHKGDPMINSGVDASGIYVFYYGQSEY